jgi:beta-lactamase class A
VLVLLVLLGVLVWGVDRFRHLPFVQQKILHHHVAKKPVDTSPLNAALAPILARNPSVKISVATVDLDNDQAANFGSSNAFVAASTAKLITAACFLHSVEQGQDSLDEQLDGYSAQFQLQQMINQSDNDSWNVLNSAVGLNNLLKYAQANGVGSYNLDQNSLTAADEAQLLTRLYKGQLLNQQHTQLLLGYMQHTNEEEMIPSAVPSGVTVNHKYGLLDGNLHDVGVLTYQGHSVALAIYTDADDLSDQTARIATIQDITKAVVQFYFGLTS